MQQAESRETHATAFASNKEITWVKKIYVRVVRKSRKALERRCKADDVATLATTEIKAAVRPEHA
jgi:hypothetical protein